MFASGDFSSVITMLNKFLEFMKETVGFWCFLAHFHSSYDCRKGSGRTGTQVFRHPTQVLYGSGQYEFIVCPSEPTQTKPIHLQNALLVLP